MFDLSVLLLPRLLASSSTQQSKSVWSLSDTEVEKREWKREQLASYDREEMPCPSSFDELLRQQRNAHDEDGRCEVANDDGWRIRDSMGLDRTLDDEVFPNILFTIVWFV